MKCSLKIFTILLLLFSVQISAQDEAKVPFKDRLVFGGDIILNIGNNFTAVGGAPLIGYKVSERYLTGISLRYVYYSQSLSTSSQYGGSIFNRFSVTDELFLHGEFEYMEFQQKFKHGIEPSSFKGNFPAILVGAGYRQALGTGSYLGITILYDILQDPNSFYNGPIIRGGVVFGR